jgi:hypothetical protein
VRSTLSPDERITGTAIAGVDTNTMRKMAIAVHSFPCLSSVFTRYLRSREKDVRLDPSESLKCLFIL